VYSCTSEAGLYIKHAVLKFHPVFNLQSYVMLKIGEIIPCSILHFLPYFFLFKKIEISDFFVIQFWKYLLCF